MKESINMNKMSLSSTQNAEFNEDLTTRDDFIRIFSAKSGYNLGQSQEILNIFQDIFAEACEKRLSVRIPYFLELSHTLVTGHEGNKPKSGFPGYKEKIWIKESTRSNIKLSKNLRRLSKSENIETQEE